MNRRLIEVLVCVPVVCGAAYLLSREGSRPPSVTAEEPRPAKPEAAELKPLVSDKPFHCPSFTVESEGTPAKIEPPGRFPAGLLGFVIEEGPAVEVHSGIAGMTVHLVNTSGASHEFFACDGIALVIIEAKDESGEWKKIVEGDRPAVMCGNSFHAWTLADGRMKSFVVPVTDGAFKTRLRFRIENAGMEGPGVTSDEFEGAINTKQFEIPPPRSLKGK